MLWNIIWKIQPKWFTNMVIGSGKYLCYQEMRWHQHSLCGQSPIPVLSLEHLIPMSHTGLLRRIDVHGAPSFSSPLFLSQGSGAACILNSVRAGIWIRLAPFRAKRSSQNPPTFSTPSFAYDGNIMLAGGTVRWVTGGSFLCDISFCDDVQILNWPVLLSPLEGERETGSPVLQWIHHQQKK